jgi:hypothetical protein
MRLSKRSLAVLGRFKSLNDELILLAPRRFFVFGEGKDGIHRGLVVEGSLPDRFADSGVYKVGSGELQPVQAKYDFKRKLQFFDDLYANAARIAQFTLAADTLKALIAATKDANGTHVRIYRRHGEAIKARAFDARKYFDELIAEHSPAENIGEHELAGQADRDFFVYLKLSTLKRIPLQGYSVTVFDNGLLELAGTDIDVVCHMRDQRLGQAFEQQLEQLRTLGSVLSLDPRRAQEARRKMKALG